MRESSGQAELVLHEALVDHGAFVDHGAERLRAARSSLCAAPPTGMRADAREVELHLAGHAARARVVELLRAEAGLQLLDVVDDAADAGAHAEAVVAPVLGLQRIHAVLEVLRHGA
jgi:hypothetical protein